MYSTLTNLADGQTHAHAIVARGIILYCATESISAHYGLRLSHGCLPNGRVSVLSPPSRKPVLPSFELPQRDTRSSNRRLAFSSWVVGQSQACSAAQCIGSWHRLTLQLLLSPVSTSGRGRRCRTTFSCLEHDDGRWRMGSRASCEDRESRAGFDEGQEGICYYDYSYEA